MIVEAVELALDAAVDATTSETTIEPTAHQAPSEHALLAAEGVLQHPINPDTAPAATVHGCLGTQLLLTVPLVEIAVDVVGA